MRFVDADAPITEHQRLGILYDCRRLSVPVPPGLSAFTVQQAYDFTQQLWKKSQTLRLGRR